MSNIVYLSGGFIVKPHLQCIEKYGCVTPVRPKTFALLMYLLEHPRDLVSKKTLLDAVWDDVTVEEQVLVQSIRELRQLFGNPEIIQTYPRKGYAWSAPVEKQVAQPAPPLRPTVVAPVPRWEHIALWVSLALVLVVLACFWLTSPPRDEPSILLVLPVKNHVQGSDHQWIPLGAMDQIIQSLSSTAQVQVMDTDHVLNLLRHAGIPRERAAEQVPRIFGASGATVVVDAEVSGSAGEYLLTYRLHYPDHVKRGVIAEESPDALVRELLAVISHHLEPGIQRTTASSLHAFSNELMAQALDNIARGEWDAARALLESVRHLEPHNLRARQSLVSVLLHQQKYGQAMAEIEDTLGNEGVSAKQVGRFYHAMAQAQVGRQELPQALAALDQADEFALRDNDLLYQAFNAQLRAHILQAQQHYDLAQHSLDQAVASHGLLRCSVGVALTRLQMVELAAARGQPGEAAKHYALAMSLVETHQLSGLLGALGQADKLIR